MTSKYFEWIERYLSSNMASDNPDIESEDGAQKRVDDHTSTGMHDQLELPEGYRIDEDGGDLAIRDTTGEVVLRWGDNGSWSLENNDINSVGTATVDALEAETMVSHRHYAGAFDGVDADARLDNALSAASSGDTVYLENMTYQTDRTISTKVALIGAGPEDSVIDAVWTTSERMSLSKLTLEQSLEIGTPGSFITDINVNGSINVNSDRNVLSGLIGGSVTFSDGTNINIIDASTNVSITDNGTNTVGDIA